MPFDKEQYKFAAKQLTFLRFREKLHIADIGCGDGESTVFLAAELAKYTIYPFFIGVDTSHESIQAARRRNVHHTDFLEENLDRPLLIQHIKEHTGHTLLDGIIYMGIPQENTPRIIQNLTDLLKPIVGKLILSCPPILSPPAIIDNRTLVFYSGGR